MISRPQVAQLDTVPCRRVGSRHNILRACAAETREKAPSGVPADAVWAGGADGGAYVRCSLDKERGLDKCIVWNDFNGETDGLKDYRLEKEHRAASVDELKFTGAVNDLIFLQNGLVLKSQ